MIGFGVVSTLMESQTILTSETELSEKTNSMKTDSQILDNETTN